MSVATELCSPLRRIEMHERLGDWQPKESYDAHCVSCFQDFTLPAAPLGAAFTREVPPWP